MIPRRIDSDPVIGKAELRMRLHRRHVTSHARLRGDRRAMPRDRMASAAGLVIRARVSAHRIMRRVAGQARQCPRALLKAGALAQVDRLMPRVPRVVPVRFIARRRRHPVASAAQVVELDRRQLARISNRGGFPGMSAARAMTGLAANASLRWLDPKTVAEFQSSRRVALKAPQHRCAWIEDSVSLSRRRRMPRCQRE